MSLTLKRLYWTHQSSTRLIRRHRYCRIRRLPSLGLQAILRDDVPRRTRPPQKCSLRAPHPPC